MPERNGRARIQQIRDKFAAMARDYEALVESKAINTSHRDRFAARDAVSLTARITQEAP